LEIEEFPDKFVKERDKKEKGNETAGGKKKRILERHGRWHTRLFLGFEGRSPTIGCGDGRGVISE